MYSALNVKDRVVLDVGALLGETAPYFIGKGARLVYAYEPVTLFYEYLVRNVELNGVSNVVRAVNAGLWFEDGEFCLDVNKPGHGLWIEGYECSKPGLYRVKVLNIAREFGRVYDEVGNFVVKFNCEGCEYSILTLPCDIISHADEYVMEVHGAPSPIKDKLSRCGFDMNVVSSGTYSIIHFRKALK
ncbi:FkbM family methyltransferase [Vulcanisaeta sp. JCM 16159]|uniref:FkbM family methyltransferase n=1 Tax=Vulcanisaeta sp. JCM 16159 TaxID=1295371 RepID=UPI0006CFBCCB|nr:FkbM family methyltransferase [Vulcanisaeta sp. JCM 16159]